MFDVPSYLAEDRLSVETVEALVAALSVRNDCPHPQGRATGVAAVHDYLMGRIMLNSINQLFMTRFISRKSSL